MGRGELPWLQMNCKNMAHIGALSKTRLSGEDALSEIGEDYTFSWRGLPEHVRRSWLCHKVIPPMQHS